VFTKTTGAWPLEKGRSGDCAGRRSAGRNKETIAAAALIERESEALTRKAVELALPQQFNP